MAASIGEYGTISTATLWIIEFICTVCQFNKPILAMISPELFRVIGSTFFVVESTPAASNAAAKTGSLNSFSENPKSAEEHSNFSFFFFLFLLFLLFSQTTTTTIIEAVQEVEETIIIITKIIEVIQEVVEVIIIVVTQEIPLVMMIGEVHREDEGAGGIIIIIASHLAKFFLKTLFPKPANALCISSNFGSCFISSLHLNILG